MNISWIEIRTIEPRAFTCGHCGNQVSSTKGYAAHVDNRVSAIPRIYVCHHCSQPTIFTIADKQVPGSAFGVKVSNITDSNIEKLYAEVRNAISSNSYTACVLACRKLLMHIAVSQGAEENLSFLEYVQYLVDNHHVPPSASGWVDHIREKGNEANHEIKIMTKAEAETLVKLCGMLLQIIYEFPAMVPAASPAQSS